MPKPFETWTCSRCGAEFPNAVPLEDGSIVCDDCLDKEDREIRTCHSDRLGLVTIPD